MIASALALFCPCGASRFADQLDPCQTHALWLEDPWNRPSCPWGEGCSRPHSAWDGPKDPELRRTNIALQTESAQLLRAKEYASKVAGAGGRARLTGTARSGTSRYGVTFQPAGDAQGESFTNFIPRIKVVSFEELSNFDALF